MHIIQAFMKPSKVKRKEPYVELASIGVDPTVKNKGVGTLLVNDLKRRVDLKKYAYITLETDVADNEVAIHFYEKNGFVRVRIFETNEGKKMFEYRWSL